MQNSLFAQYAGQDTLRFSITGKQLKSLRHIELTFSIGSLGHQAWSTLFFKGLICQNTKTQCWEVTEEGKHILALARLAGLVDVLEPLQEPKIGPLDDMFEKTG